MEGSHFINCGERQPVYRRVAEALCLIDARPQDGVGELFPAVNAEDRDGLDTASLGPVVWRLSLARCSRSSVRVAWKKAATAMEASRLGAMSSKWRPRVVCADWRLRSPRATHYVSERVTTRRRCRSSMRWRALRWRRLWKPARRRRYKLSGRRGQVSRAGWSVVWSEVRRDVLSALMCGRGRGYISRGLRSELGSCAEAMSFWQPRCMWPCDRWTKATATAL